MTHTWFFAVNGDDSSEGWAASGIKHFQAHPINSLAREIVQNSLDAKSSESAQVVVTFELTKKPIDEFPGKEKISTVLNELLGKSRIFTNNEDRGEILGAKRSLDQNNIRLLQVQEEGTTGMRGPCEPGKPFYKYMKASSQSDKNDEGARGSHGQGKNAPLANSSLRTIFVSAKSADEETLIMGRTTLASHYNYDGPEQKLMKNIGYFGNEKFQPIGFDKSLPVWLKRETVGTNISILGFNGQKDWIEVLCASVASTFFTSIHDNKLIVRVKSEPENREREISSETLKSVFRGITEHSHLHNSNDLTNDDLTRSFGLYNAYTQPDRVEKLDLKYLGKIEVFMKTREDGKRHIGLVRDDMFITDNWKGKLNPKSMTDFDVLIIPRDPAGCELIRSMEPPAHDDLAPHNTSSDPEKVGKAKKALDELSDEVRKLIDEQFGDTVTETDDLSIADEWFSFESDSGSISDDFDPTSGYVFKRRKVADKQRAAASDNQESPEFEAEIDDDEIDDTANPVVLDRDFPNKGQINDPIPHPNPPPGSDQGLGQPKKASIKKVKELPVGIDDFRAVPLGGHSIRIFFTPRKEGNLYLLLAEAGANSDSVLTVQPGNGYEVDEGGLLVVKAQKGARVKLDIALEKENVGAVSVSAGQKRADR